MKYLLFSLPMAAAILATACTRNRDDSDVIVKESYIHRYGVEVPQKDWSESGQHGQIVSTLATGVTIAKSYNAGILQGETTMTYPHSSTIEKIEVYDQGNLVKEILNYPSGLPMQETVFSDSAKHTITMWYENRAPKAIENYERGKISTAEYYNYANALESRVDDGQGLRICRDAYGLLTSTDTIQDGQMVFRKIHHPNGAPKEIIPYQDGVVAGHKRTFLPGGEPESLEEWEAGKQHGLTTFFQNGEKISEVPYVAGKKEGVEIRYRNNGKTIVEKLTWHNHQLQGPSHTYVDDTVITHWFHEGRQINKSAYDRLN